MKGNKNMNNNKNHWIYSFDDDKNISFAIASVLNQYYELNYSFVKNIEAISIINTHILHLVYLGTKARCLCVC